MTEPHVATPPVNLDDYEQLAPTLLPVAVYDYIAGGAADEHTLARNRAAFRRFLLRPRICMGIDQPDLSTMVLGQPIALPILLAPTGYHRMEHTEGELASARAAGAAGTVLIASTAATYRLEEIATAASGALWFQLYLCRDRGLTESLVRRAHAAGYGAICITADNTVVGRRERNLRKPFAAMAGMHYANFTEYAAAALPPTADDRARFLYGTEQIQCPLSWEDVAWVRSLTDLPLVVKGVMCGEDAAAAVAAGAAAVVVSNHGGRNLDGTPGTIEVLEEVVAAVQGRCEVYLDGGIRRGTDVLTALALGARAVLIGRSYLWGLAVAGSEGVEQVLRLLATELRTALILCGCPSVQAVERALVRTAAPL